MPSGKLEIIRLQTDEQCTFSLFKCQLAAFDVHVIGYYHSKIIKEFFQVCR